MIEDINVLYDEDKIWYKPVWVADSSDEISPRYFISRNLLKIMALENDEETY
jgi:hypothetical protein